MALGLQVIALLCVSSGLWIGAEVSFRGDCCKACPSGWSAFGSSCYMFHHNALSWADAEKLCTTLGGNLASVHTKEQYEHLRNVLLQLTGRHTTTWLGGYDAAKEGVWLWSDGSEFKFAFWAKGEPNNAGGHENCMEMNFRGRDFVNDIPCDPKRPFFCAKDL
ncbi:galactose-specific lectin nattectin-like [Halichoeres trimaculatus]|uniref:galactose-specific lectin nattectin-like n=1 Tax=Halichoeres trimaculatus TaxID=147232 RepID=UPI003D9ECDF5